MNKYSPLMKRQWLEESDTTDTYKEVIGVLL